MRAPLSYPVIVILMLGTFASIAAAAGQPPSSSLARAAAEREATLLKARQALATNTDVAVELHAFYRRRQQFEKAGAIASKVLLLRLSAEFNDDPGEKSRIMDEPLRA